ncbi:D-xylose ABC transporter ATP-binding protein [Staphylococcus agnetis]|uniref:sugar ABC transporter ATP-binding protein n=1 Tax=Staphylococcus agnetis TaxID=985762 RepID=UPI000D1BBDD6|nr:sugar ABC transporter ATP-binding protein [Staphylococcus agnetis]MCO4325659.1 sugar ABC transporter ATP-binding protein [Staphylococcus agnetis]MCO4356495.1 sugar ABC transporter ATP-binding protein [Staphylococcus agnetis]MCO4362923.1 sugar ABC transporter ATP-binding protein [Staphylococcus agnetis]MCO4369416.1 sugar ABC transporter ATP-binding protein [Staphylococcus agnetis]PTH32425.1 D-xylose ABC transporter ATP-binding protein [Staphylococcus agnetis]
MITMRHIHKAFGENKVLQGVDFTLKPGTVHALMGENGAGKSTLMKILVGMHQKDEGDIQFFGQSKAFKNPKEAEQEGVTFIHQELNIWPELTVLENMFIGKEIKNKFGVLKTADMARQALAIFEQLHFNIPLHKVAKHCSIGEQQMIEIAKALMTDAKVIVMDEPTATLTDKEISQLFNMIRRLKAQGVAFVYISHRMAEIFEIADDITVMRDGKTVFFKPVEETAYNDIVKAMVGRELDEQYPKRQYQPEDIILKVAHLSNEKHQIKDVSFHLRKGEILGVSGLMGAGRTEMMRSLFGVDKGERKVEIDGKNVDIRSPEDAMKHGLALITENRKDEGLILDFSIRDNMVLPSLKSFSKYGFVKDKDANQFVDSMRKRLNIKTSHQRPASTLSGGNQQKVVLAKWIGTAPRIIIFDEPTRGIDVGAKREIYQLMNELTERGVSIIMISSELPEIIGMSDRVMVVHEGHIQGDLTGERITEENIMTLATGGKLDETVNS